jgi:hypothetical protein
MHRDCRKRHGFCKKTQKTVPLTAARDAGVRLECNKYPPYPIFVKKLKKVKRKIMLKILV